MNPRAEIWNILHDGSVTSISGVIGGAVTLTIYIPYLRQMFPGDGDEILITLEECSQFSMEIWEASITTGDFAKIASLEPTILSTDSEDVPVRIGTALGVLNLDFQVFSIRLDADQEISFERIALACDDYWNRWDKRDERL